MRVSRKAVEVFARMRLPEERNVRRACGPDVSGNRVANGRAADAISRAREK